MLVEEGKIALGRAGRSTTCPWFQMSDPYVTREMTVRDLLVHRSGLGLGAGDLLWWPASTYNRKEIARRLRYIPLGHQLPQRLRLRQRAVPRRRRSDRGGQRPVVGGLRRARASSQKVGMTGSNVRHSAARRRRQRRDAARAGGRQGRPIAPFDSDNTNPAGGINSNADDMAKWMIVQLARRQARRRLAARSPSDVRAQLTSIVTPMPIRQPPPELAALRPNFNGYGLGLGRPRLSRPQDADAHRRPARLRVEGASMSRTPSLGVAVLTNQESGAAFDAIAYRIVDRLPRRAGDRLDRRIPGDVARAAARRGRRSVTQSRGRARDAASTPSLPLAEVRRHLPRRLVRRHRRSRTQAAS